MTNKHILDKQKHQSFLEQNRQDPITGDTIQENDTVIICAVCKSAFLEESWKYMGNRHCNQHKTLRKIPKTKTLSLKKELQVDEVEVMYQKMIEENRVSADNIQEDYTSSKIMIGIILFAIIMYSLTFIEGTMSFGKAFLIVGGAFFLGILVLVIFISRV